eukprot:Phypoly_transcript_11613.p1 GENE.Phypoly_transcript_11613~~Phypoly_transcript_11613.p1  ORF type:complete len:307 (+),score=38.05 Phypoly_transcript_11613:153-1073(+)
MEPVEWTRIQQNLHKLNCPYMHYISSSKSLLNAGDIRNTVMSWLFNQYDAYWMRKLDAQELSEISSLTQMAASLGLCTPNETSFVQGGGNKQKQLAFWGTLVDLIMLHEEFDEGLDNQTLANIDFMDDVARESKDIFREQNFKSNFPIPFTDKIVIPDLEARVALLTSQVQELRAQLAQLPKYNEEDCKYTDEFNEDVARSLRNAHNLLGNFSEISEKDFRPWIQSHPNKELPYMGDLSKVIEESLAVIKLLENYKMINASNAKLRDELHILGNGSDENNIDVSTSKLNSRITELNMYNSNNKKKR